MKLAIIILLAAIAMWVAFIFLGQIFYWLGLAGICVIVVILLKFILAHTSIRNEKVSRNNIYFFVVSST